MPLPGAASLLPMTTAHVVPHASLEPSSDAGDDSAFTSDTDELFALFDPALQQTLEE
jgi:hypothetical protein